MNILQRLRSGPLYSTDFFAKQQAGSRESARTIVPLVISAVHPKSVVDVGCGVGTWSAEFMANSVDATGVDGDYVQIANLQIPAERFKPVDLNNPPEASSIGSFDLAICLEVAEHLETGNATNLIQFLTDLAPNVLFGAAIPGQGGVGHLNEQWQSYWISLFADRGFHKHDIIRPAVWSSESVCPWYAQNTFLFTRQQRNDLPPSNLPSDIVHPGTFLSKHRERPIRKLAVK